jgi:hypothetical protein
MKLHTLARMQGLLGAAAAACVLMLALCSTSAHAEEVSKNACIDAHSRGQDARDQGKLSVARKLFMTCAQASCPALVQNDCARFADDLERYQPWLSFTARDAQGHDLPDTTVYVDDVLVLTQLDDGKPLEVDPGKHVVRFVNGDREQVLTVVVSSGEKGRRIVGTFEDATTPRTAGNSTTTTESPTKLEERAPKAAIGSRVMMGVSAAVMASGVVLGVMGMTAIPDNCSLSSHDCAAPPGDAAFSEASDAVKLSNIGWALTGVGTAALTASVIWYLRSKRADRAEHSVTPWATSTSAGLSFTGRL